MAAILAGGYMPRAGMAFLRFRARQKLRGLPRLHTWVRSPLGRRTSLSKKSAHGGLFPQMLKKCLRGRDKLPARPAPEGSVSPVGCCHRRWQSDPKVGSERAEGAVAPSVKIERPGKAGRYESTLEGTEGSVLWALHRRWQSDPEESTETSGRPAPAAMIEAADLRAVQTPCLSLPPPLGAADLMLKTPILGKAALSLRPSGARNARGKCCGEQAPNPGRGMIPCTPHFVSLALWGGGPIFLARPKHNPRPSYYNEKEIQRKYKEVRMVLMSLAPSMESKREVVMRRSRTRS